MTAAVADVSRDMDDVSHLQRTSGGGYFCFHAWDRDQACDILDELAFISAAHHSTRSLNESRNCTEHSGSRFFQLSVILPSPKAHT
jgi:hypothetical protein